MCLRFCLGCRRTCNYLLPTFQEEHVHSDTRFSWICIFVRKRSRCCFLFQGWAVSGGGTPAHGESNKVRQQQCRRPIVCVLAEGCAFLKSLITGEECVSLQSAESIKGGDVVWHVKPILWSENAGWLARRERSANYTHVFVCERVSEGEQPASAPRV